MRWQWLEDRVNDLLHELARIATALEAIAERLVK